MKKFQVIEIVTLRVGILALDDSQASRRKVALNCVSEFGEYEIIAPVQFKVGEVIGMDECPKGIESKFSEIIIEEEKQDEKPVVKKKRTYKKKAK